MTRARLPIHTVTVAVAVCVGSLAGLTARSHAASEPTASLPTCPVAGEALSIRLPGYARANQGLPITVAVRRIPRVTDAAVSLHYGTKAEPTVIPLELNKHEMKIVETAGPAEPSLGVEVAWTQDAGTPAECRADLEYFLRVVPPNASAGNPLLPRLFGRFAVLERGKMLRRPVWLLTPKCDFFACSVGVKSSAGLKGKFVLLANGSYVLERRLHPTGSCTVERSSALTGGLISKTKIKRAFNVIQEVRFKVVKSPRSNRVDRFSGTFRTRYPATRYALSHGCHNAPSESEPVTGHLISH